MNSKKKSRLASLKLTKPRFITKKKKNILLLFNNIFKKIDSIVEDSVKELYTIGDPEKNPIELGISFY